MAGWWSLFGSVLALERFDGEYIEGRWGSLEDPTPDILKMWCINGSHDDNQPVRSLWPSERCPVWGLHFHISILVQRTRPCWASCQTSVFYFLIIWRSLNRLLHPLSFFVQGTLWNCVCVCVCYEHYLFLSLSSSSNESLCSYCCSEQWTKFPVDGQHFDLCFSWSQTCTDRTGWTELVSLAESETVNCSTGRKMNIINLLSLKQIRHWSQTGIMQTGGNMWKRELFRFKHTWFVISAEGCCLFDIFYSLFES